MLSYGDYIIKGFILPDFMLSLGYQSAGVGWTGRSKRAEPPVYIICKSGEKRDGGHRARHVFFLALWYNIVIDKFYGCREAGCKDGF